MHEKVANNEKKILNSILTIVSPIPRLKIPAKGASGRSLNPEDIQIGSAQPNKSEKWLKNIERYKLNTNWKIMVLDWNYI